MGLNTALGMIHFHTMSKFVLLYGCKRTAMLFFPMHIFPQLPLIRRGEKLMRKWQISHQRRLLCTSHFPVLLTAVFEFMYPYGKKIIRFHVKRSTFAGGPSIKRYHIPASRLALCRVCLLALSCVHVVFDLFRSKSCRTLSPSPTRPRPCQLR
jgi:hypothetical protein